MSHNKSKYLQSCNFRGRVILPLVYKCLRDPRFNMVDELLERDTWSAEQIKTHQCKRLERLLFVGWEYNPYWREKFKRYGVNYRGSDPIAEIAKLPVLTKDEVRNNYNQMHSVHLPKNKSAKVTSSGSTGRQVTVWHSQYYKQLHIAMDYRSLAWMGIKPGEHYLSISGHGAHFQLKKRILRYLRHTIDGGFIIGAFYINPKETMKLLDLAHRHSPAHVRGYPSVMATVARLSQEMELEWPTVRAVSTTAEPLSEETRKLLHEVYDAKVYDKYGSSEVLSIAMQCKEGNHHIYEDLNYVEFVQVEDADEGYEAILLTPLDNEAMPLFRYRNGDSASAISSTCSCGSALRLMTGCKGRICNNFIAPDGSIINGTYFAWFFLGENGEGYKSFQFHQTSPEHIDLYVVPDGELSTERRNYLNSVCNRVSTDFDTHFEVDLHIIEKIERTPAGKHLYIISDCLKNI